MNTAKEKDFKQRESSVRVLTKPKSHKDRDRHTNVYTYVRVNSKSIRVRHSYNKVKHYLTDDTLLRKTCVVFSQTHTQKSLTLIDNFFIFTGKRNWKNLYGNFSLSSVKSCAQKRMNKSQKQFHCRQWRHITSSITLTHSLNSIYDSIRYIAEDASMQFVITVDIQKGIISRHTVYYFQTRINYHLFMELLFLRIDRFSSILSIHLL